MITRILLPVPMETDKVWFTFRPHIEKFLKTLREFDPGAPYELVLIINLGPDQSVTLEHLTELVKIEKDHGHEASHMYYYGGGCDFGSFIEACERWQEAFLAICCVSRVFFYRDGWLKRLVDAREKFGPGLYGTSVSKEGGRTHVCTRAYTIDSDVFSKYPTAITSRDQGTFVEVGENNPVGGLADWVESLGLNAYAVYWSGIYGRSCWFDPPNIFRTGTQENLLVKDRHTSIWDEVGDEEKDRLTRICFDG